MVQDNRLWILDDVSREAREAALGAARAAGEPLAGWLARIIRQAGPAGQKTPARASMIERLAAERRPAVAASPDGEPGIEALRATLAELRRRVARLESGSAAALAPLARAIEDLAARIEAVEGAPGDGE
jgi:hypothetical protein